MSGLRVKGTVCPSHMGDGIFEMEWRIQDRDILCLEGDLGYKSPLFTFDGKRWFFRMYSNDDSDESDYKDYIDVSLVKRFSGPPVHLHFSFALRTVKGQKDSEKQSEGVFEESHRRHSIARFLSRSEYGRRKAEFLDSGSLTLVCALKKSTRSAIYSSSGDNSSESSSSDNEDIVLSRLFQSDTAAAGYIDNISFPKKKFVGNAVKLLDCSSVICGDNQIATLKGNSATAGCSYDKRCLEDDNTSFPKKMCVDKSAKLSYYSSAISNDIQITGARELEHLRKAYRDAQLLLKKTAKEKDNIKKDLDAYKANNETLLKEKSKLEADLKATREVEMEHLRKEHKAIQLQLENTVKENNEIKKELDAYKTENVTLLKDKSKLEADLKVTTNDLDDRSLCEDFKEMLLHGLNPDLILIVGDKKLRAHRDVLRTRSQVFKSILSHDIEKDCSTIDVLDCDPQAMEQFLCYIYTGKVNSLDQNNMLKLYYIANKYEMKGLRKKCCVFIQKSLTITNICDVLRFALNHPNSALFEHATEYFVDNALDIMHSEEWQSFMKDNLTVANELTIKSFVKLKNASI